MKTFRNRVILLGISVLFGLMMGVQWMSEYAGYHQPKPLSIQIEEKNDKEMEPNAQSLTIEQEEDILLSTKREENGLSNLFSELGSTLASQAEEVTRSSLESFVTAVQNGVTTTE